MSDISLKDVQQTGFAQDDVDAVGLCSIAMTDSNDKYYDEILNELDKMMSIIL
jgi:hypothetical protein